MSDKLEMVQTASNCHSKPPSVDPLSIREIAGAVLQRALNDLKYTKDYGNINLGCIPGVDSPADAVIVGEEVRDWFWEENYEYFFSFHTCCMLLEMDKDAILERIEKYREPKSRHILGLVEPTEVDQRVWQMIADRGERGIDYELLRHYSKKTGIHFRIFRDSLRRLSKSNRVYSKKKESIRRKKGGERRQVVRYYANV